jgi:uncharacterized membrane protein
MGCGCSVKAVGCLRYSSCIMAPMDFQSIARKSFNRIKRTRWLVVIFAVVILGYWLIATPDGLLGKADAVGYAVCHRIDTRSFHLGDRTLPLCSRCSGTYLGVVLTLSYLTLFKKRAANFPPKMLLFVLGLFFLMYALDGLNSYLSLIPDAPHLYEPSNLLRLTTGMFFGISLASIVYPGFNQSLWLQPRNEASLDSIKELGILVFTGGLLILAVILENPLILYPVALISTVGVLILLTMVYTMVILIITRKEALAVSWKDLVFPAIGGITLAILQIGLIDLGRYFLMGTWEGFNFL